jgi:predicted nucleotidyltransferase
MQFHNLAETLLGSKVKIKVLRTLWKYEEKEFTIRELAKFLRISHTGIKKVLDELEKTNVVKLRTLGKSHAFKLNANSYAARIVEDVFEKEAKALSELQEMLRKGVTSSWVTSAALFGSVAKAEETPLSDIDLFIVTENRKKVEEIIAELQKDVSEKFGNSISAYYVSKQDLKNKRRDSPIKQVLQDHLLICGKPLR